MAGGVMEFQKHLFPRHNDELVIDNFAGGGGASIGIARAIGPSVDVAINHNRDALRMLQPRELAIAQGVPDDYILTGTKTQQVKAIGNSVSPPPDEALVRANYKPAHVAAVAVTA